ncbi:thioredoxin-like protein 4B isoform X1 [Macaca thibetana thibetana]|uniref:thioredoxin-like protein 4B isoform X1 n=1 Tax=Macaca thibetana thibetana TaxID=257877 RepID=UPI0021BC927C|nr:thioredoxin-like protein 4B isoform X1 [Macaca thibetana thibetana]XP_050628754.1 thioredoxin-like protein 4B isoform X1 [Macaca thibetana thibetana]XP_050628755.1 thioredoxin-like protein 4B isoform X1 [Macaca thibetana thibetana]XP_050628756.1 thioredoxin-like protein 4B isoform X1 [Macaca thibetana thibetana]
MSFLLPKLTSKKEVDQAIKSTAEKVLVLRFGRDEDPVCLQLDDILSKTSSDLSKMAAIYLVDVDQTPVYTQYFDISYIPSTVFFFNGQHMKVDYGGHFPDGVFSTQETSSWPAGMQEVQCSSISSPEALPFGASSLYCCQGISQIPDHSHSVPAHTPLSPVPCCPLACDKPQ